MPLDHESAVPTHRPSARFWLVAVGGGAVGFVAWCALDFVLVRFAPSRINDFDWLMLPFPFVVGGTAVGLLRHGNLSRRLGLAILAAIMACILAVVLILFLGISFHFAIGGHK